MNRCRIRRPSARALTASTISKRLLAKAGSHRSGDQLAGLAAATEEERVAAKMALADLPLRTFINEAVISYEHDVDGGAKLNGEKREWQANYCGPVMLIRPYQQLEYPE